jgi:hypothetical protein
MKRSHVVLAGAIAGAIGYAAVVRPRTLKWGSTWREQSRVWAGDEFMPEPLTQSTRVITIHAPAERVWPWIAQIGQDRGGFYSYTPLENIVGAEMKNAEEIHQEWQHRNVGDKVWLATPSRFDGKAHLIVARWIPERLMVLVAPPDWDRIAAGEPAEHMVWSFIVEPISPKSCRLIVRSLGGPNPTTAGKLANYMFWEPAHFIMERGMMLGIKTRVERGMPDCLPVRVLKTAVDFARAVRTSPELSRR